MEIIFTKHAKEKLFHRGIEGGLVLEALSYPDFVRPSYGNREVAYKKFSKNYLAVIFIEEGSSRVVVTAHWVAKAKGKK